MSSLSLSTPDQDLTGTAESFPIGLPVLVLEGDKEVAEFLGDYLSEQSLCPVVCRGLSQAIDLVIDQPEIRMALVDIRFGPSGGFAAGDELLAVQPGMQLIYMSSYSPGQPGEWQRALSQGAHDIIGKPLCGTRLLSALKRAEAAIGQDELSNKRQRIARVEALISHINHPDHTADEAMASLISCAMGHDPDGPMHCHRVGRIVSCLARAARMDVAWSEMAGKAAELHDIGMIGLKPLSPLINGKSFIGRLASELNHGSAGNSAATAYADAVARSHTALGHGLLANSANPVLALAAEIALSHHEHWDGTGYPIGLKEQAIPYAARLTAAANAYDSLRFKKLLSHDEAVNSLHNGTPDINPAHYDPQILALFKRGSDPFVALYPTA